MNPTPKMKTRVLCSLLLLCFALGDVYLHMPRGSNNRLDEAGRNRNNGNRLFDSQNNNRGGYNVGNMNYTVGSILTVEWTNQHGCGSNPKVKCELIMQYMCNGGSMPYIRDGTTTRTIPTNQDQCRDGNCDLDPEYGEHENFQYYTECTVRPRNKGLFLASQNINRNRNSAKYTRQNPNGNRRGYECPEERDYYPYWHPSPWKDIAVFTTDVSRCDYYKENSQNVVGKGVCRDQDTNEALIRISDPEVCAADNNTWVLEGAHNISAPLCAFPPWSRVNHLGNTYGGHNAVFNWTIPDDVNDRCVFRLRYNITTGDYDAWNINSTKNDRNGEKLGLPNGYKFKNNPTVNIGTPDDDDEDNDINLELAINTAQFGRTFQDRSHAFAIIPRPEGVDPNAVIHNLNVRGKRGNIVQTYPGTEYDFAPNRLAVSPNDYIHLQWTGSNTNPNNNDGQGQQGSDRSNVMQMTNLGQNTPMMLSTSTMWDQTTMRNLALLYPTQKGGELSELDDAGTYYDAGVLKAPTTVGTYNYMCTRNNNFSNRSQKATIVVTNALTTTARVEPSGGLVAIPAVARLNVVPNALTVPTTISVAQLETPPTGAPAPSTGSKVIEIQPVTQKLATPITASFHYDAAVYPQTANLQVLTKSQTDDSWRKVENPTFDPATGMASVEVDNLGYFVVAETGLDGGAIAGIVIGTLAGIGLMGFAFVYTRNHPEILARLKGGGAPSAPRTVC